MTKLDVNAASSVDLDEIAKFSAMAAEWWDPHGKFKPLHRLNPARLTFIRDTLARHFKRDPRQPRLLDGLTILDIGCGGGLLSEPLCRLGATLTGADASSENIQTAKIHAEAQGLNINYQNITAEALTMAGKKYDAIINMEVVEHTADVQAFLSTCASLLKPKGIMIVSTLNRTAKAYAMAIVGAEYVMNWLPRGTHDWDKFLKPSELKQALEEAGLTPQKPTGMSYNPLKDQWSLSDDVSVNYMIAATKNDQVTRDEKS